MSKKRDKVSTSGADRLTHNPFAALVGETKAETSAVGEAVDLRVTREDDAPAPLDGKIVVRRESKGRGGKTVTRVTGLPASRLDELAARMKKALGCGAVVEEGDVVLLGNVQDRAAEWLAGEGARRIVQGN